MPSWPESTIAKKLQSKSYIEPLVDRFGRPIKHLRISLTQRCNHQCFFCHHEGENLSGPEMTAAEIESLVRLAVSRGIRRVKLTGGEPLMRTDIIDIVRRLSAITEDLSLTTNGSLLGQMAIDLKKSGLDRVNVSLHSLNPNTHQKLTGNDDLETIKDSVTKSVEVGFSPVKINMTLLKGYNESEIPSMIEFAAKTNTVLQLIELQCIPAETWSDWSTLWVDLGPIEEYLSKVALSITKRHLHGRKVYTVPTSSSSAIVEVVRPTHNSSFCKQCTRLRVTSDGKLKPCLLIHDNLVDVKPYLIDPRSKNRLEEAFEKAVSLREPFWREEDTTC